MWFSLAPGSARPPSTWGSSTWCPWENGQQSHIIACACVRVRARACVCVCACFLSYSECASLSSSWSESLAGPNLALYSRLLSISSMRMLFFFALLTNGCRNNSRADGRWTRKEKQTRWVAEPREYTGSLFFCKKYCGEWRFFSQLSYASTDFDQIL